MVGEKRLTSFRSQQNFSYQKSKGLFSMDRDRIGNHIWSIQWLGFKRDSSKFIIR